jgi:hypothetical protein
MLSCSILGGWPGRIADRAQPYGLQVPYECIARVRAEQTVPVTPAIHDHLRKQRTEAQP